jgi:O-acetyl-ADP-ribose deacetylase (regulator of RNase III)
MINLILCDISADLVEAWTKDFVDDPNVAIYLSSFEDHIDKFDCLVSPANSFGLMDGGFDAALINFYGQSLQDAVQWEILTYHQGEQLVGTSRAIEIPNHPGKNLLHTPTMRCPKMIWGDVVYCAMFAMLNEALSLWSMEYRRDETLTILCPGLGTGAGNVPPEEASRQMHLAWKNFNNPPKKIDWEYASKREIEINASPFASLTN